MIEEKLKFATPDEVMCPSCGRYVGAYEICPNCQAKIEKRVSLKLVRRISIIGAAIGVILLFIAAKNKEVPLINVGNISINNNMALVKVKGTVVSQKLNTEKDSFRLTIDDGTGRLTLNGFNRLKKFQNHFKENFPQIGDYISVTGNLAISEKWGASMFLTSPLRLKIIKKFVPEKIKIKDIKENESYINKLCILKFKIEKVYKFKIGYNIKVSDETGEMNFTVFTSELEKLKETTKKSILAPGSVLEILAKIGKYKGKYQIRLGELNDNAIKIVKEATVSRFTGSKPVKKNKKVFVKDSRNIADISKDDIGKLVQIKGTIQKIKRFRPGTSIKIADKSGQITVWLKNKILKFLRINLEEGTKIQVRGVVSKFKNQLQIVPEHSKYIQEVK